MIKMYVMQDTHAGGVDGHHQIFTVNSSFMSLFSIS